MQLDTHIYPFVYPLVYPFVYLFVYLSTICLFVYLSSHYLHVCLSVCLSTCLFDLIWSLSKYARTHISYDITCIHATCSAFHCSRSGRLGFEQGTEDKLQMLQIREMHKAEIDAPWVILKTSSCPGLVDYDDKYAHIHTQIYIYIYISLYIYIYIYIHTVFIYIHRELCYPLSFE